MSGIWAIRRQATRIPANLLRAGVVGFAVLGAVGVTLAVTTANAQPPEPRLVTGNVTTCEGAGLTGEILLEGQAGDASSEAGSGTVSGDGTTLDVTINEGFTASGIAVKGGPDANVYDGPFVGPVTIEGMTPPENPGGNIPAISHWFVCGFETPPSPSPTESPTASPTESPTASPTESPTASPTESPTASPTESPTASPTASVSPTGSPSVTPGVPASPPPMAELPETGTKMNLLLGSAAAFLISGALLIAVARQRRAFQN